MKKSLRAMLLVALVVIVAVLISAAPAFAGPAAVPQGASFELVSNMGVNGGAFWLYSPSKSYNWTALLSKELDSVMFVYPNAPVASEAEAWKIIETNGLVKLAENNAMFIVVPKPMNGASWGLGDLRLFNGALFYLAGGASAPPFLVWQYPVRAGSSRTYVMAEGNGATFVHTILTKSARSIAGVLTFGGTIADTTPGEALPAYLVNADATTIAYYKGVNGTNSSPATGVFVNSGFPLKKVITADIGPQSVAKFQKLTRFIPKYVADAWDQIFSVTARPNMLGAFDTTGAGRVLNDRPNYQQLGITRTDHLNEALPDGTKATWYDFVPTTIKKDQTTKVPLVITLHGMSGDPVDIAETPGWVNKAAEKGFIVVSPAYVAPNGNAMVDPVPAENVVLQVLKYAEANYPIDVHRVYLTGYSMGGFSTALFGLRNTDKFAAIAPMGATGASDPQLEALVASVKANVDLPFLMLHGALDNLNVMTVGGFPAVLGFNGPAGIDLLKTINELPVVAPDYAKYPYWGFKTDSTVTKVSKDLHFAVSSMSKDGKLIAQFVLFKEGAHTHEDFYATLAWDFFSQFTR
jgi:poly(3-hydroxybutyrate) depolymerase